MSFKNIAIISVLKPVNNTRSYEKMAKTLVSTGRYSLTIIGSSHDDTCLSTAENIQFSILPKFNRLGIRRLFVPGMYLLN